MKTKKTEAKKAPAKTTKNAAKTGKKPVLKTKTAKVAAKKIVVKAAVKPSNAVKKPAKKSGIAKPLPKTVVDTIKLPKGGKLFVKAVKRPTAKKSAKKTTKK